MVQGLGGSIVFILAAMNERSINKLRRTGEKGKVDVEISHL
jgi:hypothetical protein